MNAELEWAENMTRGAEHTATILETLTARAGRMDAELALLRSDLTALSNRVEALTRLVASTPGMREAFASVMGELREHSVKVEP